MLKFQNFYLLDVMLLIAGPILQIFRTLIPSIPKLDIVSHMPDLSKLEFLFVWVLRGLKILL
jgi:hypothetical protein